MHFLQVSTLSSHPQFTPPPPTLSRYCGGEGKFVPQAITVGGEIGSLQQKYAKAIVGGRVHCL